jgi:hypothetical protein
MTRSSPPRNRRTRCTSGVHPLGAATPLRERERSMEGCPPCRGCAARSTARRPRAIPTIPAQSIAGSTSTAAAKNAANVSIVVIVPLPCGGVRSYYRGKPLHFHRVEHKRSGIITCYCTRGRRGVLHCPPRACKSVSYCTLRCALYQLQPRLRSLNKQVLTIKPPCICGYPRICSTDVHDVLGNMAILSLCGGSAKNRAKSQ